MQIDEPDYFENEIMESEFADALERENAAILELELERENRQTTPERPEASARKKLKRELEAEALLRLEDSARTDEDFQNVITWWNRLDDNRERRERYHEIGRSDVPLEWGISPDEIVIPAPIQNVFWRQLQKGEFLDAIFTCPFELHELLEDRDMSSAVFELKDVQKELMHMLFIRDYSCQVVAAIRNQTDRNILKVRDTMLRQIRKKMCLAFQNRIESHIPMTKKERAFFDSYKSLITSKGNIKTI